MDAYEDAPPLTLLVEVDPPLLLVRLCGEIDLSCVDLLDSIDSLNLNGVRDVTLDLEELEFADAAGATAILRLRANQLAAGREVRMTAPRRIVRKVFDLLGEGDVLAA
jgi:anti-anti-sigma factor